MDYSRKDELEIWSKVHRDSFYSNPAPSELAFIRRIYSVEHFQHNISSQKLLKGGPFADPFIIAKAYVENGTVVSQEEFKPHSARIPNICEHFHIPCIKLQEFIQQQKWSF
jgi:hypothetical protein